MLKVEQGAISRFRGKPPRLPRGLDPLARDARGRARADPGRAAAACDRAEARLVRRGQHAPMGRRARGERGRDGDLPSRRAARKRRLPALGEPRGRSRPRPAEASVPLRRPDRSGRTFDSGGGVGRRRDRPLSWSYGSEPDLAGYRVYRSTTSGRPVPAHRPASSTGPRSSTQRPRRDGRVLHRSRVRHLRQPRARRCLSRPTPRRSDPARSTIVRVAGRDATWRTPSASASRRAITAASAATNRTSPPWRP